VKNRPPYPLESVDNALRMLHVLRDQGRTGVSDAAAELGIGRSTAHRLLQPHMEALCERAGETVNLMVRVGTQTRFLASVESAQVLHVGDRQGTILPAWRSSGGKALLAELADEQVLDLFRRDPGGPGAQITGNQITGNQAAGNQGIGNRITGKERTALPAELRAIRRRGYAENLERTEAGVSAVGMCVRQGGGAVAALSISVPTVRYTPATARFLVAELRATIRRIEDDPAFAGPENTESAGR
jgi:DNA-binding IclR family transcriptional regulator